MIFSQKSQDEVAGESASYNIKGTTGKKVLVVPQRTTDNCGPIWLHLYNNYTIPEKYFVSMPYSLCRSQ